MSRTANEQALLDAAGQIENLTRDLNEGFSALEARITDLEGKARSPEAHEVEDLSEELDALRNSLKGMERIASSFRGKATRGQTGGQSGADASGANASTGTGRGVSPLTGGPLGTEETGPGGMSTIREPELTTTESGQPPTAQRQSTTDGIILDDRPGSPPSRSGILTGDQPATGDSSTSVDDAFGTGQGAQDTGAGQGGTVENAGQGSGDQTEP